MCSGNQRRGQVVYGDIERHVGSRRLGKALHDDAQETTPNTCPTSCSALPYATTYKPVKYEPCWLAKKPPNNRVKRSPKTREIAQGHVPTRRWPTWDVQGEIP